jgi:hypothetical protein
MVFFGDKLQKGGNDFPVKKMLEHTIEVQSEKETEKILTHYTQTLLLS